MQGLRVLDLTRLLPGPVATLRLAELGADVLKIEAPAGAGDESRKMMQSSADRIAGKPGAFYRIVNRGKRETRLDLKSENGRKVLEALAREADVLIESFRPGVMARLGVGYDTLHAINPKLVYCSISGYGSQGPLSARPGHDLNYIAYAGVLDQLSSRDGVPVLPNFQIADLLGGALTAVTQILAALWQVARGGKGRFIDVSMTHSSYSNNIVAHIALANARAQQEAAPGSRPAPEPHDATRAGKGLLNGGVPCYNLYRTQDDRWLAVGALEFKFWETFCNAIGQPAWASRHWSQGQAIGGADAAALVHDVETLIAKRPLDEWVALLEPLDCCVSPVLTPDEASRHRLFDPNAPDDDDEFADLDLEEDDDAAVQEARRPAQQDDTSATPHTPSDKDTEAKPQPQPHNPWHTTLQRFK
ncbi:CaiB/BaiF CoA transferase family protein [Paraburkholderia phosphatilytica]|uniref:CaiB/BaiF CoA transferase family protein n=1 Tax=Paraburkholderia phosphatilytica TaxID=2282883 RepID=UPI000E4C8F53|nr:CaiB/BaiF CoA-transferase family protein [Paraburkholderia phosphatilytica]